MRYQRNGSFHTRDQTTDQITTVGREIFKVHFAMRIRAIQYMVRYNKLFIRLPDTGLISVNLIRDHLVPSYMPSLG